MGSRSTSAQRMAFILMRQAQRKCKQNRPWLSSVAAVGMVEKLPAKEMNRVAVEGIMRKQKEN